MDRILPAEILSRILSLALNTPSVLSNLSDDTHVSLSGYFLSPQDIDGFPVFEGSRIGRAHEISFVNWPADFHHNLLVYEIHRKRIVSYIRLCKTFEAILTPILYQLAIITTSNQALGLARTLRNRFLATLVRVIIICPVPVYHLDQKRVDNLVRSCPNLIGYHNFSKSHSHVHASLHIRSDVVVPAAGGLQRLSHNSIVIALQLQIHSSICNSLVFLEVVTPACFWTTGMTKLRLELPNLSHLKMEQRTDALEMMQGCLMPNLQYLSLTRPRYHVEFGIKSSIFIRKHGRRLTQLEYHGAIWGTAAAGEESTLESVCPDLRELIIDPVYCVDINLTLPRSSRLFSGPPRHSQVSDISLRNIASRVMRYSDSTPTGGYIIKVLKTMLATDAFPKLNSIRDAARHRSRTRSDPAWDTIMDLCAGRRVVFKDWKDEPVARG